MEPRILTVTRGETTRQETSLCGTFRFKEVDATAPRVTQNHPFRRTVNQRVTGSSPTRSTTI